MINSEQSLSLQDISPQGLERSRKLASVIAEEISLSYDNVMPFNRFMSLALYADSLGYYVGEKEIFGAEGDFVTAPESGELFGSCLAEQCQEILGDGNIAIAEFGAGTGALAGTILRFFDGKIAPQNFEYFIIEPSPYLTKRQKRHLSKIDSELVGRVSWYETYPTQDFMGVAIANEMFDAMPARRFTIKQGKIRELGVGYDGQNFFWKIKASSSTPDFMLKKMGNHPEGYTTEYIEGLGTWFSDLKKFLTKGVFIISDYGYVGSDFFHLERITGTLRCYFNHYAHDDPFMALGLQDITTSVNFSLLAESASSAGFSVSGFTSQAKFLIGNNLEAKISISDEKDAVTAYRVAQEAKRLILPNQMGESFKFMACSADVEPYMSGFADDERFRLG